MKRLIFLMAALCLSSGIRAGDAIDNIYQLLHHDKIAEARQAHGQLPPTTIREGNRLFVGAYFERAGAEVEKKLEAAIRSDLDGKYTEEAYFLLIQVAEAEGDTAKVLSAGMTFLNTWETSGFRERVLAMLAAHARQGGADEERYLDLLIDEYPATYLGQFARLTKARSAFDNGRYETAAIHCRRINSSPDDNLTPASLILLSRIGLRENNAERALLNYNILREQYQHAIGQDELVEALRQVSESRSGQEADEVYEGITYSVQVGVFAEKSNAKNMAKRVEAYGYKTETTRRNISGNDYYVVMAGRFTTMKDAQTAKEKLELGEHEIFKVIVHDEK